MNRREFLLSGGALLLAGGCRSLGLGGERTRPVAVQLWNINKIFWDDPARHLAALKAMGVDGVEFAGFARRGQADTPSVEVRRLLADAGLAAAGAHVNGVRNWKGDGLRKMLDYCQEVGCLSYTLPWFNAKDRAGWDDFIRMMNAAADEAGKRGMVVGFHNHFHEFEQKLDGVCLWDYIYTRVAPNVMQQVDTSQAIKCGVDPLELLKRYPNRNWYVHIKENYPMASRPHDPTTPVDLAAVTAYLNADPGFHWYILEDERDPYSLAPTRRLVEKFLPLV